MDGRKPKRPERAPKRREALTQQRRAAHIDLWGDPSVGRSLARAMDVGEQAEVHAYTHGFHSWAARMHPITARRSIELALRGADRGARVVDPFCGSGTVLVEAMLAGARATGVDASPLAQLVSRVKTRLWPSAKRRELVMASRRIAAMVVQEGKAARRSGYEAPPPHLPLGMDPEVREARLKGWFDRHVRAELEMIAAAVDAERDDGLRQAMAAMLSSIVVKMSRRDSDTSKQQVTRKLARGMAARLFAERAELLADGLGALERDVPPGTKEADVRLGDARDLVPAGVEPGTVAAVVTSPPYPGTYDYLDHQGLRMAFLGLPPGPLAEKELGARRDFHGPPGAVETALNRWRRAMEQALAQMSRALAPRGRVVLVMGDSLAGMGDASRAVYADDELGQLAPKAELVVVAAASAARPALGTFEKRAFAERAKREHLVLLERAGG
jgi:SAM-dependent methyltransferase